MRTRPLKVLEVTAGAEPPPVANARPAPSGPLRKRYAGKRVRLLPGGGGALLRQDPTRTIHLRQQVTARLRRKFMILKGRLVEFLVVRDALGLRERKPLSPRDLTRNSEDQPRDDHGRWTATGGDGGAAAAAPAGKPFDPFDMLGKTAGGPPREYNPTRGEETVEVPLDWVQSSDPHAAGDKIKVRVNPPASMVTAMARAARSRGGEGLRGMMDDQGNVYVFPDTMYHAEVLERLKGVSSDARTRFEAHFNRDTQRAEVHTYSSDPEGTRGLVDWGKKVGVVVHNRFDPAQPRDEAGRWSDDGGAAGPDDDDAPSQSARKAAAARAAAAAQPPAPGKPTGGIEFKDLAWSPGYKYAEVEVGGRDYRVSFEPQRKGRFAGVEVYFGRLTKTPSTWTTTGYTVTQDMSARGDTGAAAVGVFRKVGEAIDKYIKQERPPVLKFRAYRGEGSRVKLYDKMVHVLARRHGYEASKRTRPDFAVYTLTRKADAPTGNVRGLTFAEEFDAGGDLRVPEDVTDNAWDPDQPRNPDGTWAGRAAELDGMDKHQLARVVSDNAGGVRPPRDYLLLPKAELRRLAELQERPRHGRREMTLEQYRRAAGEALAANAFDPDQPRDDQGRWSESGILRDTVASAGGFTYRPGGAGRFGERLRKWMPAAGTVVSLPRERGYETPIPEEEFRHDGKRRIAEYLRRVRDDIKAGKLDKKHTHVGAWHDKATGRVVLDVNEVYKDKEEAVHVGKERAQDAVFDLGTFTEIDLRDAAGRRPTGNAAGADRGRNGRGTGGSGGGPAPGVRWLTANAWFSSFFGTCDRDERGRCLPGSGGDQPASPPTGTGTAGGTGAPKGTGTTQGLRLSPDEVRAIAARPEFKAWFGDSKVVDRETGDPRETAAADLRDGDGPTPRVVYHGTAHGEFDEFREDKISNPDELYFGRGFYFTEDVEAARVFANTQHSGASRPTVMPLFLKVSNPFDADRDKIATTELPDGDRAQLRAALVQRAFTEDGRDEAVQAGRDFDAGKVSLTYAEMVKQYGVSKAAVRRVLEARGHDGITVESAEAGGERGKNRFWITFRPTQIKSVRAERFDPNDPKVVNAADQPRDADGRWTADGGGAGVKGREADAVPETGEAGKAAYEAKYRTGDLAVIRPRPGVGIYDADGEYVPTGTLFEVEADKPMAQFDRKTGERLRLVKGRTETGRRVDVYAHELAANSVLLWNARGAALGERAAVAHARLAAAHGSYARVILREAGLDPDDLLANAGWEDQERDEQGRWVGTHSTLPDRAAKIREEGFKVGGKGFGAVWGHGVYVGLGEDKDRQYATAFIPGMDPAGVKTEQLSVSVDPGRVYVHDPATAKGGLGGLAKALGMSDEFKKAAAEQRRRNKKIEAQVEAEIEVPPDKSWEGPDARAPYLKAVAARNARLRELGHADPQQAAITRVLKEAGYDSLHVRPSKDVRRYGGNQLMVLDPSRVSVRKPPTANAEAMTEEEVQVAAAKVRHELTANAGDQPRDEQGRFAETDTNDGPEGDRDPADKEVWELTRDELREQVDEDDEGTWGVPGSASKPWGAKAPPVDFDARDNQNAEDYLAEFPGADVYARYVPLEDLPTPKLAEEDPDLPEDERGGYDWGEMEGRVHGRGFPPPKMLLREDGELEILDGNHRLYKWEEQGYTHIPVLILDQLGHRRQVEDALKEGRAVPPRVLKDYPELRGKYPTANWAAADRAAEDTDPDPTEARREAGNYRKGSLRWRGLDLVIETPKGVPRRPGYKPNQHHYGYVRRTRSDADGDAMDVFLGPDPDSDLVVVVDQLDRDGDFDEHKVMLGFGSREAAVAGYRTNYPPGWTGFGGAMEMTVGEFKAWLRWGDTSRPICGQDMPRTAPTANAFDPDQPRDERGRWADTDGVAPVGARVSHGGEAGWTVRRAGDYGSGGYATIQKERVKKVVPNWELDPDDGPAPAAPRAPVTVRAADLAGKELGAPPTADDPPPGGRYEYHAASLSKLREVQGTGKLSSDADHGISVAAHLEAAKYWGDFVHARAPSLLLRMDRTAVRAAGAELRYPAAEDGSEIPDEDPSREHHIKGSVPLDALQAYVGWRWVPLRDVRIEDDKPTTNAGEFAFESDPTKLKEFEAWLRVQLKELFQGEDVELLWKTYALEGFRRGAGRAWDDINARKTTLAALDPETGELDFLKGGRTQFLRSAFGQPEAVEKLKLLAERSYLDLANVTEDMASRLRRTLTDGLSRGANPRDLIADVVADLDVSRARAETIGRSEIIRAHAEGQLHALEELGVEEVGVAVEWSTAGDDRVCPRCAALEGVVLRVSEAHNLIPLHPNCRCAFLPANVGEDGEGQTRSKKGIEAAALEAGLDLEVGRRRPRSVHVENAAGPLVNLWREEDHPRGDDGRFTDGGGGGHVPDAAPAAPPEGGGGMSEGVTKVLRGERWLPFVDHDDVNQWQLKRTADKAVARAEAAVDRVRGTRVKEFNGWDDLSEDQQTEAADTWKQEWVDDNRDRLTDAARAEAWERDEDDVLGGIRGDEGMAREVFKEWVADYDLPEEDVEDAFQSVDGGGITLADSFVDKHEIGADELNKLNEEWAAVVERAAEEAKSDWENEWSPPERFDRDLREAAQEEWDSLSDEQKFRAAGLSQDTVKLDEPDTWRVGLDGEDGDDEDYRATGRLVREVQAELTTEEADRRGVPCKDPKELAGHVWREWVSSSTQPTSLLLQHAASLELGGFRQHWTPEQRKAMEAAAVRFATGHVDDVVLRDLRQRHLGNKAGLEAAQLAAGVELMRAHVRATWAASQLALRKAGVEELPLYRGLQVSRAKLEGEFTHDHHVTGALKIGQEPTKFVQLTDVRLKRNGAASTAVGEHGRGVANSWGGVGEKPPDAELVTLRIVAPRESVLSLPVFGKNIHDEHEAVITGTKYRWDAWRGRAPSLAQVPMGGVRLEDRPREDAHDRKAIEPPKPSAFSSKTFADLKPGNQFVDEDGETHTVQAVIPGAGPTGGHVLIKTVMPGGYVSELGPTTPDTLVSTFFKEKK